MHKTKTQQTYPLTSSQRELWSRQRQHPDLPMYNIGGYLDIPGTIDANLFNKAINLLVQKHDNLRMRLINETDSTGIPYQTCIKHLNIQVPVHDFSAESDSQASALIWIQTQFEKPFKLINESLFQYHLIKLAKNRFFLVILLSSSDH